MVTTLVLNYDKIKITESFVGALDLRSQPYIQNYTWTSEYSTYSSQKEGSVDKLWDDIVPAHGIVAVNHKWAAQKGLPISMDLPTDNSKGVYVIDAYHQIHCLVSIESLSLCWI